MKFTIVLPSKEDTDLSIGAVFNPGLVWVEGAQELLSPHPHEPLYQRGDLQQVIALPHLCYRVADSPKRALVICHRVGHGTETCLERLVADLKELGFNPGSVRL
jgi:hypothetical protein